MSSKSFAVVLGVLEQLLQWDAHFLNIVASATLTTTSLNSDCNPLNCHS